MSVIKHGSFAGAATELVENLCREFIDETMERLRTLDAHLDSSIDINELRQFAFELKGQAHNFEQPLVEAVAQRLESFLAAVDKLTLERVSDVRAFLDNLADIFDGKFDKDDVDPARAVRDLPARPPLFDANAIEVREVEVLLVMLHGAQTHFVEREMQACGYRTSIVTSPFAAFQQIIQTKPDIVIISAVLTGLSGIDLAIALSAMPETRNTPLALITALDPADEALRFVPDRVPIIHKSDQFGDDLAKALSYHFLL